MRFITRFRPSPALVVASIALFVALAGTSVAAVTLIGPNTVASPQVVDGSLQTKDLNASQRSEAFSRTVVGPVEVAREFETVASLRIPTAGSYLIWAKLYMSPAGQESGKTPGDVTCDLLAGDASDRTRAATTYTSTQVALLTVAKFTAAANVSVRCGGPHGAGHPANLWVINLTALRVAGLTSSRTGSPT